MKRLFFFLLVLLPFVMGACSDDDKNDENDFEVPELTESNSIQYTFTPDAKLGTSIGAAGNNIAIDWGDGTIDKCKSMPNATNFSHTYAKAGTYRIKIWSEGLTRLSLFEWGGTATKLSVGNSPHMESFRVEAHNDLTSLKLENCPNLTSFSIIECENLLSLDLTNCPALEEVECNDNNLKSLNVSACRDLASLICSQNQIQSLDLKTNTRLRNLNCDRNKLTSLDVTGVRTLEILNCYQNELTTLNTTFATGLRLFACGFNKLTTLDVQNNSGLLYLMCANNELTELKLATSTRIIELYCGTNKLSGTNLDNIFKALPEKQKNKADNDEMYRIQIKNNPGEGDCDIEFIKKKGWTIIDEEITPKNATLFIGNAL